MPPPVEPAQPPMVIYTSYKAWATGGQDR